MMMVMMSTVQRLDRERRHEDEEYLDRVNFETMRELASARRWARVVSMVLIAGLWVCVVLAVGGAP